MKEDVEIKYPVKRLCIMLTNLELFYPNARSLVPQLLGSARSIYDILKSENTNCNKKCFQISFNHFCTGKPGALKLEVIYKMLMDYPKSGFKVLDVSATLKVSSSILKGERRGVVFKNQIFIH